jgi:hypothetical protein
MCRVAVQATQSWIDHACALLQLLLALTQLPALRRLSLLSADLGSIMSSGGSNVWAGNAEREGSRGAGAGVVAGVDEVRLLARFPSLECLELHTLRCGPSRKRNKSVQASDRTLGSTQAVTVSQPNAVYVSYVRLHSPGQWPHQQLAGCSMHSSDVICSYAVMHAVLAAWPCQPLLPSPTRRKRNLHRRLPSQQREPHPIPQAAQLTLLRQQSCQC